MTNNKNTAKYLSYKAAWERITPALDQGYFLEAIAIEESIMADRLLSYVQGVDPKAKLKKTSNFSNLIDAWKKLAADDLKMADGSNLGQAVDAWRQRRNAAIHGLVKSSPGESPEDVGTFLERAKEAAVTGKTLARAVQNWHAKKLMEFKRK